MSILDKHITTHSVVAITRHGNRKSVSYHYVERKAKKFWISYFNEPEAKGFEKPYTIDGTLFSGEDIISDNPHLYLGDDGELHVYPYVLIELTNSTWIKIYCKTNQDAKALHQHILDSIDGEVEYIDINEIFNSEKVVTWVGN